MVLGEGQKGGSEVSLIAGGALVATWFTFPREGHLAYRSALVLFLISRRL